jgi:hypothetical protein
MAEGGTLTRTPCQSPEGYVDIQGDGAIYRLIRSKRWIENGELKHEAFYRGETDEVGLSVLCSDRCPPNAIHPTALGIGFRKVHGAASGICDAVNELTSWATGEKLAVRCSKEENELPTTDPYYSHAEIHGLEKCPKSEGVFFPSPAAQNDARRLWKRFVALQESP